MCLAQQLAIFLIEILTAMPCEIWIVKNNSLTFAMAKDDRRERHRSLLHFTQMNIEGQIQQIEEKVRTVISADPQSFLVEIKIKPGNNVKVFIDADNGVSIDKLSQYNRTLHREIAASGVFPNDDFSLEISSPGLEEPLKLHRQYVKNIGRDVEVLLKSGVKMEGRLASANDSEIVVEEEKRNKKLREIIPHTILYNDIKATKIQIKF